MSENNLPSTHTPEEQAALREHIEKARQELLFYNVRNKKVQYTKAMVTMYSPIWWDEVLALLKGEDKDMKKLAIQEINKLQSRLLPLEVGGADGNPITVRIVDFASNQEPIDGEIIENNGDTIATQVQSEGVPEGVPSSTTEV